MPSAIASLPMPRPICQVLVLVNTSLVISPRLWPIQPQLSVVQVRVHLARLLVPEKTWASKVIFGVALGSTWIIQLRSNGLQQVEKCPPLHRP